MGCGGHGNMIGPRPEAGSRSSQIGTPAIQVAIQLPSSLFFSFLTSSADFTFSERKRTQISHGGCPVILDATVE
jgi:hypothetical protein